MPGTTYAGRRPTGERLAGSDFERVGRSAVLDVSARPGRRPNRGPRHLSSRAQATYAAVGVRDVEVAIAAVRGGAEVVRRQFGMAQVRVDKGAGDFATSDDIDAEITIVDLLRRERPEDAVLGEESGRVGARDRRRTWLIDPICGTLNYAARVPTVAVNAALCTETGVAAAAVAAPFTDEVFWAEPGAAQVRINESDEPLRPTSVSNLDPALSTRG